MRTIGVDEINDIALGASLLGAGGGGDPYIGRLMAMQAVKECGPVTLIAVSYTHLERSELVPGSAELLGPALWPASVPE